MTPDPKPPVGRLFIKLGQSDYYAVVPADMHAIDLRAFLLGEAQNPATVPSLEECEAILARCEQTTEPAGLAYRSIDDAFQPCIAQLQIQGHRRSQNYIAKLLPQPEPQPLSFSQRLAEERRLRNMAAKSVRNRKKLRRSGR